MPTLFDGCVNEDILSRIGKLTPTSKPLWGKLNVLQMLAHIDLSLQVNLGQVELKKDRLRSLFKGVARKILLSETPFPKHLTAPKKTLPKQVADFETEKRQLEEKIQLYKDKGPAILCGRPHNILGKISADESAFISYKHIDHHLRQFGV